MNKWIRTIKLLDVAATEKLISREPAWLHWTEEDGKNALHFVCAMHVPVKEERVTEMVRFLLDHGLDIDVIHYIREAEEVFRATPLWYAYAKGRNENLYTFLLDKGANPQGCMFAIAWNDDVVAADRFFEKGARITDEEGLDTPLLAAVFWRRFGITRWFVQKGADLHAEDKQGKTALLIAMERNYSLNEIRTLLALGADPSRENSSGITPLAKARNEKLQQLVKLFEA